MVLSTTNMEVSSCDLGNVLKISVNVSNFAETKQILIMKRISAITLGVLVLASCSQTKTGSENNCEACNADSVATEAVGSFKVCDFDNFKLHIYLTDDEMADASFIVEGQDSLVTLEQPLFTANASEYDAYLAGLNKPVAARIADFHLGNTGADTIIMPAGMPEVVKGPQYSGMMSHFAEVYGDKIVALPTGYAVEMDFDNAFTEAGVPFTFLKGASNDFPGANILIGGDVVYSHRAPAKAHVNNLYASDMAGVDARIAELEQILGTGATLYVGGHGAPATADDVRFRIGYLNKVKELRASQPDAASFVTALEEAYPGLPGEEGVKAFAEAIYAE